MNRERPEGIKGTERPEGSQNPERPERRVQAAFPGLDPGAEAEEKTDLKTTDHDRRSDHLPDPDHRSDPAYFRLVRAWKREDNGYGRGGIHIPGIRYQRKRNLLKGNDEK